MDDNATLMAASSAVVMGQLVPQMDALTNALPGLLALGPNIPQLVTMGQAMFQGALQIPAASSVQAGYVQGIQQLADVMTQAVKQAA
ncbi:MAG: hypothetical protein JWO70_4692 [Betaproteobacteria bacterium]|jgi:hypothetical protein|nr:hypothetical protein [Betaproteobacteria bacterium]